MPGLPAKAPCPGLAWKPPRLAQPETGFRFTTDALLLASFAGRFSARRWCDLGTGNGVVAHILATRNPSAAGIAVERQKVLLRYAVYNLKGLPVTLIDSDIRSVPWHAASLDLAVCNPPYYEVDAGQINQDKMLARARHTFYGTVLDFAESVRPSLADGVFCFIFPSLLVAKPLKALTDRGWHLVEKLSIHPFAGREAKRVCLAVAGKPEKLVCHELVLYRSHRVFTKKALHFLATGQVD